jgi:secondary thiamine-phosphate synthase enzyme
MKFEFSVRTEKRTQFVVIDQLLQQAIEKSKIANGTCTVFVPHTTAAVTINENADSSVVRDILMETEKIVPFQDNYRHMEGNSAAHIKTSFFGSSETIIIENGRPAFGTWQSLYFCDFDGPRTRKVWFSFISEDR